jgi:hypothetical protein
VGQETVEEQEVTGRRGAHDAAPSGVMRISRRTGGAAALVKSTARGDSGVAIRPRATAYASTQPTNAGPAPPSRMSW